MYLFVKSQVMNKQPLKECVPNVKALLCSDTNDRDLMWNEGTHWIPGERLFLDLSHIPDK